MLSRGRIVFFIVSLLLVSSLAGGHWMAEASRDQGEDSLYKYLSTFTEVLSLIRQAYVDETDMDALMAGALDGATDALDPFSIYLPAGEVEPYLAARRIGNRYSGLTVLKERGIAYVVAVDPGSPAAEAGVQAGDLVSTLDGRSTRLLPLWEVQELFAGEPGTKVEMVLIRLGEEENVSFELAPYESPAASLERVEQGGRAAGVLRVARFEPATAGRVEELLGEARRAGYDRLLVDLRNAAEGDPAVAYAVGGLFAGGELGKLVKRDVTLETFRGGDAPAWKGELVVLTNRGTLGASEVLAAVLRQSAGAELVGEGTFGHAGRQDLADLPSGGRLVYTDAFFTGPDGAILDESLEPDVSVDFYSRDYSEREVPQAELIYRRGVQRLFEARTEAAELPEAA